MSISGPAAGSLSLAALRGRTGGRETKTGGAQGKRLSALPAAHETFSELFSEDSGGSNG